MKYCLLLSPWSIVVASAALAIGTAGCGGDTSAAMPVINSASDAPLDQTHIATASSASAGAAYFWITNMIQTPIGHSDAQCGTVATQGNTTTVTGMPCPVSGPVGGTLTITGATGSQQQVVANNFAVQSVVPCNGAMVLTSTTQQGSASLTPQSDGSVQFHLDVVVQEQSVGAAPACTVTTSRGAFLYDGTLVHHDASGSAHESFLYNGLGQFELDGWGRVSASTSNELIDGNCTTDLISGVTSGTTTLTSGSHVAVLQYGTHCPTSRAVDWTLDGAAQPQPVPDVACSAQPWRARGGSSLVFAAGLLGATVAMARRRSRSAPRRLG